MNDLLKYETPKNDADFTEYHQVAISMNNYIERLLQKIMRNKGMTNKSQCVRNLIYEEYQRMQSIPDNYKIPKE